MNPNQPFNFLNNLLPNPNLESIEFSMDLEPVHVGASLEHLRSNTEIIIYNNSEDDTSTICSICQLNLQNNDILRKLKSCSHQFHLNCVDQWFEKNVFCPICRTDVRESDNNQSIDQNINSRQPIGRRISSSNLDAIRDLMNANLMRNRAQRNLLSSSLPNTLLPPYRYSPRPMFQRPTTTNQSSVNQIGQSTQRNLSDDSNQLINQLLSSLSNITGPIGEGNPLRFQSINISYHPRNEQESDTESNSESDTDLNLQNNVMIPDDIFGMELEEANLLQRPVSPINVRKRSQKASVITNRNDNNKNDLENNNNKKPKKKFFKNLFKKN